MGEGVGNFLCYGDFPTGDTNDIASFLVPRGVILDRDLSTIHEVDLHEESQIEERGVAEEHETEPLWLEPSGEASVSLRVSESGIQ